MRGWTGARRIYPRDVKPGDHICVRPARDGGWYTDAASVQRGMGGRTWLTVLAVTLVSGSAGTSWYRIETNGILDIPSAPNAKVLVMSRREEQA